MRSLRRFFRRLISWSTTQRDEDRLRQEIEEHLALQTAENVRAGLAPAEARRQAILKFGAIQAVRESYRDQRGLPRVETLLLDARHALRSLRKAPAFTITIVLTLALGIGATTSIFTLVHAVLLKSLPVAKPDELYRLGKDSNCCYHGGYSFDKEFSLVSYDLYKYLRDNTGGFSELAAFPAFGPIFGVRRARGSEAVQIDRGEFVSGNYFAMFGIGAYTGRMLTPQDDREGAPPVAVMSYRLWEQSYGSDPLVLGSVFQLNEKPFTVVGIAPPGFFGDTLRSAPPDFFLPLNTEPYIQTDSDLKHTDTHWLEMIGRIQPGTNPASIEAEMRVALKQWLLSHWGEMNANDRAKFPDQTLYLRPGGAGITSMRERYERWLQILMAVTGFALLIVCANVANLMLVRGMERRRQTSLSMALGARTSRLVSQPLIESIVLSLFGGAAGLAIAFAGTRLILHFAFPSSGGFGSVPINASPSLSVLLFAFLISLATGIAFGIAPAWMATRADPIEALRGTARSTSHSGARVGSLPRKALVVFQAALSLVLLAASGLLTAALQRLENQDFGFDPDRRIVANFNPRLAGYGAEQLSGLYRNIHDSIAGIPGVSSVALCLYSPQSGGGWGSGVAVDGHPVPGPKEDSSSMWERVTAGYFNVIGTAIVKGRGISEEDAAASRHVAVVNEAFVRKFFKHEDPIGKHFGPRPEVPREFEIVGVAQDARYLTSNLDQPPDPFFFLPEAQADYTRRNLGSLYLSDIVILTKPGVSLTSASIRQAMASVDPNLPLVSIRSLREQVAGQFTQQRLIARLTSFFGILSLVLASIGLYGVTAYNAGRRINEVGVRMALGANRGHVVWLVVRGAFVLIACGLLLGLPLAFAAGRLLASQLYGLNPYNPVVTLAAVVALGLSALVASFVPAVRASLISPMDALRTD
jgi:predicted permease